MGAAALLIAALLYHRLREKDVLLQATRARLFEAIVQTPGLRAGTLATSFGLDYKTVRHHLGHLVRVGLVRSVGAPQGRYYASNATPAPEDHATPVLACPSTRRVFDLLKASGARDLNTLTIELGLAKSTVSEAAASLRKAGLVERRREHRRVVLSLVHGPVDPQSPRVPS